MPKSSVVISADFLSPPATPPKVIIQIHNLTIHRAEFASARLFLFLSNNLIFPAPFFPETIIAIYALNALGAVANVVDPRVPEDKLMVCIPFPETRLKNVPYSHAQPKERASTRSFLFSKTQSAYNQRFLRRQKRLRNTVQKHTTNTVHNEPFC